MYLDSTGHAPEWNWGTFWIGVGLALTAVGAIVASVGVLSVAVLASPLMLAVAGVTLGAGILVGVNALATFGEAATGYNIVRDGIFNGLGWSDNAYDIYSGITQGIAIVGSLARSIWQIANAGKIKAFKAGEQFLGKGYSQVGQNRFVSQDGLRQMRLDFGKFAHRAPNHINLQSYLVSGLKMEVLNAHVYFNWWRITGTIIIGLLS